MPLPAPLADPWFEAEFIGRVSGAGHTRQGGEINGAQGIFFYSPCGYGEASGVHGVIVLFANPHNAPVVGPSASYPKPRWTISGSGLRDLTLSPSIDCTAEDPAHVDALRAAGLKPGECRPGRRCWHGYIQNGLVTG